MAQAGNYHDKEAGSSLDDDIERFRNEFEVEICRLDGDPESDLLRRQEECNKNPGHVDFIPEPEFTIEHLPVEWRDPLVYKTIRATARRVVHLSVFYTSTERPDGYFFSKERGQNSWRFGTGLAEFPDDFRNKQPQQCPFKDCKEMSHPHNVTPEFYVYTASHVVYDSSEAKETLIRFFFDSEDDTKSKAKITAQGLRCFASNGIFGELFCFTCVSHNLNIGDLCLSDTEKGELEQTTSAFDTEEKKPEPPFIPTGTKEKIPQQASSSSNEEEKRPEQPLGPLHTEEKKPEQPFGLPHTEEKKPEQPLGPPHTEEKKPEQPLSSKKEVKPEPQLRDTNSKTRKPLVVIVSHPHGCSKHISTGDWTGVKSMLSNLHKLFENVPLRNLTEMIETFGFSSELCENVSLDTTVKQMLHELNMSFSDLGFTFFEDIVPILNPPSSENVPIIEICHKILLAIWDETTSNSKFSKQVSERKIKRIALSVLNDISTLKTPMAKEIISESSLDVWQELTSVLGFIIIRQLSREQFSDISMRFLSARYSQAWKDGAENCSLFFSKFSDNCPKFLPGFKSEEGYLQQVKNFSYQPFTYSDDQMKAIKNSCNRIMYSTPSCPGSSGAPIIIFYDENGEVGVRFSFHFGTRKGFSTSGMTPFMSSVFEKQKQNIDKPPKKASQDDIPLD